MSHKDRRVLAFLLLLVVIVAACSSNGQEAEQPASPTPEGNPANSDVTDVSFDLKPDGCDFVCLARSWLGGNVAPVKLAEADD